MEGFGAALEQAIIGMIVLAFIVGGLAALGLYFLVTWLWTHVSVTWT